MASSQTLFQEVPVKAFSTIAPRAVLTALLSTVTAVSASAQTTVFSSDFNSAIPSAITPGTAQLTDVQKFAGLGPTGNQFGGQFLRSATGNTVTLTLTGLPDHSAINLSFLFAAIDSLDGTGSFPSGDFFHVKLDGSTIFRESFANATPSQIQSYTAPAGVTLARHVDLGFGGPGGFYTDSAYNLGADPVFQNIAHRGSTATFTFLIEGEGIQDLSDESWAMDNLSVSVNAVPEPETYALLLAGMGALAWVRRRQNRRPNTDCGASSKAHSKRSSLLALATPVFVYAAMFTQTAHAGVYAEIFTPPFGASGAYYWAGDMSSVSVKSLSLTKDFSTLYGATMQADSDAGLFRTTAYSRPGFEIRTMDSIFDTLSFQNYLPGQMATLYYSIDGKFADYSPQAAGWGSGKFYVQAYTGPGNNQTQSIGFNSAANGACGAYIDLCLTGHDPDRVIGSFSLPLTGDPYHVLMKLNLDVSGMTADFSSTARLYLVVPNGVTYTSGSGTFLTKALPISSVSEPQIGELLLAGLGALGVTRSRRRSAQVQ